MLRRQLLVTCFTENITKEIMWSHYANYGRGFALEYDEDDIKELANGYLNGYVSSKETLDNFGLSYVDYSTSRLDGTDLAFNLIKKLLVGKYKDGNPHNIKLSDYPFNGDVFNRFVLYKDISWKYEDEIRLILPNRLERNEFCFIGHIMPKAIYLGEFIDFNDEYTICSIAKNKNTPIYKMTSSLDKKKFGLKKRRILVQELEEIIKDFKEVNFYD